MSTVTSTTTTTREIVLDEIDESFDTPQVTAGKIEITYVNSDYVSVILYGDDGLEIGIVNFSWDGWSRLEQKIRGL